MGSMLTKNSPGLVEWRSQKTKKRNHVTHRRPPIGTSADTAPAMVHTHHAESHVHPIAQDKNATQRMVPSDVMEPQKTSLDGVETQSLVKSSGSAKVVSGILGTERVADPIGEITVQTEDHPTDQDSWCEGEEMAKACKIYAVGQAFHVFSERSNDTCAPESPLPSSTVSGEDIPLEVLRLVRPVVQEGASRKTLEDLHSPLNGPGEEEPFANDQKASSEMDVEPGLGEAVGATEDNTVVQNQFNEASSGATLVMVETHFSFSGASDSSISKQFKRRSKRLRNLSMKSS